jgi:hypothetical protein
VEQEGANKDRRTNPFRLGLWGLLLLVIGTLLTSWAATREAGSWMAWLLAGQFVFLAGLIGVIAAGIIWFRQAQAPEEPEPPRNEGPDPDFDQPSPEP